MKHPNNELSISGKRFLICQPLIHGINGSTLVTLELADYLQSRGAIVDIFTLTLHNPAKDLFLSKNLKVSAVQNNPIYKLEDYDYIWTNSQVLPPTIINDLGKKHKKYPAFIFLHMSSMEWIPDEHPFVYMLEERLSSLSLYICEAVRDSNTSFFYNEPPYDYYRNPAPNSFLNLPKKTNNCDYPKKILFVSNYLPEELKIAKKILSKKGISVEILGEGGDSYSLLTPKILQKYDAVVSIAKTVQYCLVSGVPIYIYGKFGGAGWLTSKNLTKAKMTNFCGSEGFLKKSADEIVSELLSSYIKGKSFQEEHLEEFMSNFSLEACIPNILNNISPKELTPFDSQYLSMLRAAQYFERVRFEEWSNVWILNNNIREIYASRFFKICSKVANINPRNLVRKWTH